MEGRELGCGFITRARGNAAARSSDLLPKRRELAEAWARYCAGGAEVIDLAEVRSA